MKKTFPLIARGLCVLLLWGNMGGGALWAQKTKVGAPPKRPRLVLLIAVDQFRYDFLDRFAGLYSMNGIGALLRKGASWTQANYDHTPTYTAPGHATMMTGAWPAETGIIGNEWPDLTAGKSVTSVSDDDTKLLGGETDAKGASPRRLTASTVGDELRLTYGGEGKAESKVIGISLKDRAAILPAGRGANAAYWFSSRTGTVVSSTYYFEELPAWVKKYNQSAPANKFCGLPWTRLRSEREYLERAGADSPPWEAGPNSSGQPAPTPTPAKKGGFMRRVLGGVGKTKKTPAATPATPQAAPNSLSFPHQVPPKDDSAQAGKEYAKCYGELAYTPFGNDLVLGLAQAAITNEKLGSDDAPDVLTVSFSANDYVGHRYGPYSQEVMDISLRVDKSIGTLLDFANQKVGADNVLVIFTADHGVSPIPEHAQAMRLPGERLTQAALFTAIRRELTTRFKYVPDGSPDNTADYLRTRKASDGKELDWFTNDSIYINYAAVRRDGFRAEEAENAVCAAALSVSGIARCFTRTQLEHRAVSPTDDLARRVLHGYYPSRSGDVIIVPQAYKYLGEGSIVATHGSPYSYDTHVPLIIMGAALKSGRYAEAATPADIAPTIAHILNLQPPSNSVGRVLIEGLK